MFVFADRENALHHDLVIIFAVSLIDMRRLDSPPRKFGLMESKISRVSDIHLIGICQGIIHGFHIVKTES